MNKIYAVLTLCGLFSMVRAQNGAPNIAGAYGAGMGNAGATYYGVYSAFSNQAGLAMMDDTQFGAAIFAERRFFLAEMQHTGFAAALPTKSGTFAVSATNFGDKRYSEQRAGLAYARKLGKNLAIGAQFDYIGTRIAEYSNTASLTFEVGMQAKVLQKFRLGAHIFSPIRVKINEIDYIPTVLSLGAAFEANKNLLITGGFEQNLRNEPIGRVGVDYKIIDALSLRAGVSTNPTKSSFGIGLHLKPFQIDIAAQYHPILGFTPSISLLYLANRAKNKKTVG
jgi:hypothetical protein